MTDEQIEKRLAALEKDSHPPIDLRPAIVEILEELASRDAERPTLAPDLAELVKNLRNMHAAKAADYELRRGRALGKTDELEAAEAIESLSALNAEQAEEIRALKKSCEEGHEREGDLFDTIGAAERENTILRTRQADLLGALKEWYEDYDGWNDEQLRKRTDPATFKRVKQTQAAIKRAEERAP
jgi:hypothetical protein